jgi:L-rhamnose isomerase
MKELAPDMVSRGYESAKERYALWGVDVEKALDRLAAIPLSLHCWQGDDVYGFESAGGLSGGGIQTTGSYPGRARTGDELRTDIQKALTLIPGTHRVSLHAIYAETGDRKVERDALDPKHFSRWISWARSRGLKLDFNQTFFSHPRAQSGFTLSSRDPKVRSFWVDHARRCREIGEAFGREQGSPCVVNLWIQDGYKDTPADRYTPRALLKESLDRIYERTIDPRWELDALEGKLFGIGSESYVVGSHEFYFGYALKNDLMLTLDMGHYHPTESVADKISSLLLFSREMLFHISRGVRWDSDHVVTLTDELRAVAAEIGRADAWRRTHLGLDYFDASINRVAAWVIGARAALKAILTALLEPTAMIQREEEAGNHTARLAMQEEVKDLPCGAVWDWYCQSKGVPAGASWMDAVAEYEKTVQSLRK